MTSTDVFEAAIAIEGDKIAAIGPEALLPPADRVIDAQGKYVLPGLIDCHLHVGPEYDDWKTAPLAAAYTGLTTLLPFVTYDEGESLPGAAARLREEASALSVLDFGFHFILNHEPHILEGIAETFRMGVTSFKLFMTYKKRPKRMVSDEFIAKTMERLAALGGLCQLHCENGDVLCYLEDKAIAQGRTAPTDFPGDLPGLDGGGGDQPRHPHRPAHRLPGLRGASLSTQLGLERIKRAQAEGQKVWTETCPQYLLLTDKEMQRLGPFAKIGPPLRPADGPDRAALWADRSRLHLHGGERSLAARPRREGAGAREHLRRSGRQADPVRRAVARDARAADVHRGRRQSRAADDVDGARPRRESRAHLRALPEERRDPRGRRRRPVHLGRGARLGHRAGAAPRHRRLHAL